MKFTKKELESVIRNLDQPALDAEFERCAPLMRAVTAQVGDKWLLMVLMHHTIDDNMLLRALISEIGWLPGHDRSLAQAIGNAGHVVGVSTATTVLTGTGFLWHEGGMIALPPLPGDDASTALFVNSAGVAVGLSVDTFDDQTRFVEWENVDAEDPDLLRRLAELVRVRGDRVLPLPAIAAVNLLGGLALAGIFAWILAEKGSGTFSDASRSAQEKVPDPFSNKRVLTPFVIFLLLAVQVTLGAWLTLVDFYAMALPAHGLLAVLLVPLLVWLAGGKPVLLVLAVAAPIAGFTALHYEYSALAALAHAAAASFLVAATAYALGRFA